MPDPYDAPPADSPEPRPTRDEQVRTGLAEVVRLVTGIPPHELLLERRWVEDLRVDSLAMVEILEGAARHFDVRVEDEAAKQFVHVGDLVDYLGHRLA